MLAACSMALVPRVLCTDRCEIHRQQSIRMYHSLGVSARLAFSKSDTSRTVTYLDCTLIWRLDDWWHIAGCRGTAVVIVVPLALQPPLQQQLLWTAPKLLRKLAAESQHAEASGWYVRCTLMQGARTSDMHIVQCPGQARLKRRTHKCACLAAEMAELQRTSCSSCRRASRSGASTLTTRRAASMVGQPLKLSSTVTVLGGPTGTTGDVSCRHAQTAAWCAAAG